MPGGTVTVRAAIVSKAQGKVGYLSGQGYDTNASDLQYPGVAEGAYSWCGRFATWCPDGAGGDRLPALQSGCTEGFLGVIAGFQWASSHGFLRPSTQAQPGDLIGFQWDGQGLAGNWQHAHVEVCEALDADGLHTIGGNSGPNGGVNRHVWVPGGSLIIGAIDVERLLALTAPFPAPHPAVDQRPDSRSQPQVPSWYRVGVGPIGYRRGGPVRTGGDVELWARFMHAEKGYGGDPKAGYTPQLQQMTTVWQREHGLQADGYVGPATAAAAAKAGAR